MLTADNLRVLARAGCGNFESERAYITHPGGADNMARVRRMALESFGDPTDDEVVQGAIDLLGNDDRNLRFAALRVLTWYGNRSDVNDAILDATRDKARRVKRLAVSLLPVDHPGAAERLVEVADDDNEYHRIRSHAFIKVARKSLRPEALASVRRLLDREVLRKRLLHALVTRPTDDGAATVLREIVRVGDKDEAIAATRALCGYRLVRSDDVVPELGEPADIDWVFVPGSMTKTRRAKFYWVPAA